MFLERPVAVTTVASDLLALPDWRPTALARFEREAKAAARLHHANITTVYDAAVTENVCCLVVQLIDGTTLDNVIDGADDGRLSVQAAAAVTAQLCAGLSAAHAADLVHRDLKPQNVMVGADGVVKVLDFGLVKVPTSDIVTRPARLRTGRAGRCGVRGRRTARNVPKCPIGCGSMESCAPAHREGRPRVRHDARATRTCSAVTRPS